LKIDNNFISDSHKYFSIASNELYTKTAVDARILILFSIFSQEEHIKVIISLLEKHGRDPKVLDVLCSLCVGNGVAVRSSQNNICDYLLPGKNLLLHTLLVDHVGR
jgi:hypothetical protein